MLMRAPFKVPGLVFASFAALIGISACTPVSKVVPGADVLWKDDVAYDGDGLEYPHLASVPDRPAEADVAKNQNELTSELETDLNRAETIRKKEGIKRANSPSN